MVNVAESQARAETDVAVARRQWWPDALIAVVLGLTALLYRRAAVTVWHRRS